MPMVDKEIFEHPRGSPLRSLVIVRFEVLDKHTFATRSGFASNRVLNVAARNFVQMQRVRAFNWVGKSSRGDRESTFRWLRKHFSSRASVFLYFSLTTLPFSSRKEHFAARRCFCVLRKHSSTVTFYHRVSSISYFCARTLKTLRHVKFAFLKDRIEIV